MVFAQLTYRESLRDTVLCLRAMHGKLHQVGIQTEIAKSTLADANEKRDWRIYCDSPCVRVVVTSSPKRSSQVEPALAGAGSTCDGAYFF